ncbi:MAG: hypothetical protein PHC52_00455 [Syntrophales bacterium]|nr:hypothetical protein [Syntrophales bacterium]
MRKTLDLILCFLGRHAPVEAIETRISQFWNSRRHKGVNATVRRRIIVCKTCGKVLTRNARKEGDKWGF